MIKNEKSHSALEVIQYLIVKARKSAYDNGFNELGDNLDNIDYSLGLITQSDDCTEQFEELLMALKKQGLEVPSEIYFNTKK